MPGGGDKSGGSAGGPKPKFSDHEKVRLGYSVKWFVGGTFLRLIETNHTWFDIHSFAYSELQGPLLSWPPAVRGQVRQVEEGHQVRQPRGFPVLRALPGLEQELGWVGRRDENSEGQLGELRQEGEAILATSGRQYFFFGWAGFGQYILLIYSGWLCEWITAYINQSVMSVYNSFIVNTR